ncbi:hypothetical protein HPB47_003826 [Ixodes persulcatus]|uniref:Uncharacterized protein n=1 Tax=Ixodes persulcatus TaxID=34615 RepID=A0AC60PIE6_IXOPE|nr:hypothetical protein HPB47_003826 [Ixodes persulcatus]
MSCDESQRAHDASAKALKGCTDINNHSKLVATHYSVQEARLLKTNAGRQIPAKLGYVVNLLPITTTDSSSAGKQSSISKRYSRCERSVDDGAPLSTSMEPFLRFGHPRDVSYPTAWDNCIERLCSGSAPKLSSKPLWNMLETLFLLFKSSLLLVSSSPPTSLPTPGTICALRNPVAATHLSRVANLYSSAPCPPAMSFAGKPFFTPNPYRDPIDTASSSTVSWKRQGKIVISTLYLLKLPLMGGAAPYPVLLPAVCRTLTLTLDTTISSEHAHKICWCLLMFLREQMAPLLGDRSLATTRRTRPPPPSPSTTSAA